MTELMRTPLYDRHVAAGAKTADFGGWDMPIEYTGVVAEHAAVRENVGMFDVSHMGKVRVFGPGAVSYLNTRLANDLDRIGNGQAQYSMLCNERGGVIDDLIVYRWAEDEVFIIPNASNAGLVVEALCQGKPEEVGIVDHHHDHGIIAVQGPGSVEVLDAIGFPTDHEYMTMVSTEFRGSPVVVCRTGYTGEKGFELVAPVSVLGDLWDAIAARDVALVGLGARDTLRTEMGYPLHGQDISQSITPVEAVLSWAVGWDKPQFDGREALTAQRESGSGRRLRGLLAVERAIPRAHMSVHRDDISGPVVGEVTSGTFSPTLKQGVALALLDSSLAAGDEVVVDVRGRPARFQVTKPPFVESSVR